MEACDRQVTAWGVVLRSFVIWVASKRRELGITVLSFCRRQAILHESLGGCLLQTKWSILFWGSELLKLLSPRCQSFIEMKDGVVNFSFCSFYSWVVLFDPRPFSQSGSGHEQKWLVTAFSHAWLFPGREEAWAGPGAFPANYNVVKLTWSIICLAHAGGLDRADA